MHTNRLQINFFYGLLISVIALIFFIFLPFFKILFIALVLSVVFYPLFKKLNRHFSFKGGRGLSALFTVLVVLLVILVPFMGLTFLIFQEVSDVYVRIASGGESSLISFIDQARDYLNGILPFSLPEVASSDIRTYANQVYDWFFTNFRGFFSGILSIGINIFILVLALFFFFRDGEKSKTVLLAWSPLNDTYDQGILSRIIVAINSVIKGSLFIAIIQGILATIGFAIFGVPSAILWGAAAVFAAIIPSVGTAIVVVPAVIFLLLTQGAAPAIGLLVWGGLIVGLVDNLLRPVLLEREIKIHPFLILISVLGGISFFGPIGFLAGPVILSLLFTLIQIYPAVVHEKDKI